MKKFKLNPWNWFKKEREQDQTLPVEPTERESVISPLDQFHADFDHMVQSMFNNFGFSLPGRFEAARNGTDNPFVRPRVDISGSNDKYVIEAELPGVDEKDLAVSIEGDLLVLTAEKRREEKTEEKGYYRVERSYGSFRRELNLPVDADRDNISAKLENGVLRVTLPRLKGVEGRSRRIAIDSTPNA